MDPNQFPNIKPGDPTTALSSSAYNYRNQEIEAMANREYGSGLLIGSGRSISRLQSHPFWAKLGNNSNPYSFVAQIQTSPGVFIADPNDLYGTALSGGIFAYEVNNVNGLSGKIVWLIPGAFNDFRFQYGTAKKVIMPAPCNIIITLVDRLNGDPIEGATVNVSGTVYHTNIDGQVTIGPIDSDEFPLSITITYGGCSYTGTLTGCVNLNFCYCHATIDIEASTGTPHVYNCITGDTLQPPDWTGPGDGVGHYVYCNISLCSTGAGPGSVCADDDPGEGYLPACDGRSMECDDEDSISLTPYDYTSCFVDFEWLCYGQYGAPYICYGVCGCRACLNADPTPQTNLGGIIPKQILVQFNTDDTRTNPLFPGYSLFGGSDGVWYTLNLTFSGVNDNGYGLAIYSICNGGEGNFKSFGSGYLNWIGTARTAGVDDFCQAHYNSTQPTVIFGINCNGAFIEAQFYYMYDGTCNYGTLTEDCYPVPPFEPYSIDTAWASGTSSTDDFCRLYDQPEGTTLFFPEGYNPSNIGHGYALIKLPGCAFSGYTPDPPEPDDLILTPVYRVNHIDHEKQRTTVSPKRKSWNNIK